MKATTKKTRWLLIALLFGFLATAGLLFTAHHGARMLVAATLAPPPQHAVLARPLLALLADTGGTHTLSTRAGTIADGINTDQTSSNSRQPHESGHSSAPSDSSTTGAAGRSDEGIAPAGGPAVIRTPGNTPSTAATGQPPQAGAGEFAYDGYVPLDCELPAGCGGVGAAAAGSRLPTATAGGRPGAHVSGSIPADDSGSQPIGGGNPGSPDPPNDHSSGAPPVASAPELDPVTEAGALTLLLGSLAVLRSRRRARAAP
jgi:hypothetical protein